MFSKMHQLIAKSDSKIRCVNEPLDSRAVIFSFKIAIAMRNRTLEIARAI